MSSAEFLALTPRQYYLLLDRHHERVRHAELLAGTVAAAVANSAPCEREEAVQPADFFPELPRWKKPRRNRRAIADKIRMVMGALVKAQKDRGEKPES